MRPYFGVACFVFRVLNNACRNNNLRKPLGVMLKKKTKVFSTTKRMTVVNYCKTADARFLIMQCRLLLDLWRNGGPCKHISMA
jgi:hypothetical protein